MFTLMCAVSLRIDFFFLVDKLFCCYSGYRNLGTVKSSGETKVLQSGAWPELNTVKKNQLYPKYSNLTSSDG